MPVRFYEPAAPDAVLGIVNVQGRIVPVFNLRGRFRLAAREISLSDQLIIAHTTRRAVALVTDTVSDVLDCPARDVVEAQHLDKFLSLNEEKLRERAISNA